MRLFPLAATILMLLPTNVATAQTSSIPPIVTSVVGDQGKGLHWKSLECEPTHAVMGMLVNEGGWTSGVQLACNNPAPTGARLLATPQFSQNLGGSYGTHEAQLMCPNSSWMVGLTGSFVNIGYDGDLKIRTFLARLMLVCRDRQSGSSFAVPDPTYQPPKLTDVSRPLEILCPDDMVVMGMDVAIEPDHHPDVKAIKLHCKTWHDL